MPLTYDNADDDDDGDDVDVDYTVAEMKIVNGIRSERERSKNKEETNWKSLRSFGFEF